MISIKNKIEYIIVQAGGKGSRMNYLTFNKPKCLISIKNKPILFYLFEIFSPAKFLIIADYKKEVLEKYLKIYASSKYSYQIIKSNKKGTLSGIKKALQYIPKNKPFIITWSDLLFWDNPLPEKLNFKNNYLGLSKNFTCRWRFYKNNFSQIRSKKYGVAGFFIFSDKSFLKNLPQEGEFVKYLKDNRISFTPLFLKNTEEVGTFEKYLKIIKKFPPIRPFNKIEIKNKSIIKIPLDSKGKNLALLEENFYQTFKKFNFPFFPKLLGVSPLTLEKVNAKPLFFYKNLSIDDKKDILKQIIFNLKIIHQSKKPIKAEKNNDYEAIIGKTWQRLNEIASLITNLNNNYFIINNKKCINFYKNWKLIESISDKFYPKTYSPIHGDLTFSNTLYSLKNKKIYFIDPRGYYGKFKIYGDIDYDWAKIYYSLKGNYDQFNIKNFILKIEDNKISLQINSNGWEKLEPLFFKITKADKLKILLYHGIIWLSLTTYAWDNIDSILGAFYNGIYWLNIFYEHYKKTF